MDSSQVSVDPRRDVQAKPGAKVITLGVAEEYAMAMGFERRSQRLGCPSLSPRRARPTKMSASARTRSRPREEGRPGPRPASSKRSSERSGDSGDPEPAPDRFRLTLVHQKHARAPVNEKAPRYCRCDRDKPYTAPNWDIEPDGGHCRSCDLPLRKHDVRRWHAIARDERARLAAKGWWR
jgi:hypothetical protein